MAESLHRGGRCDTFVVASHVTSVTRPRQSPTRSCHDVALPRSRRNDDSSVTADVAAPRAHFHLVTLADELPPPPPKDLDPFLDAAAACFTRHGIGRTSVPDIARELGISRTTVYRQVGTVERVARLLLARETHRLLGQLPAFLDGTTGPELVTRLIVAVLQFAREDRVLDKVLADEPELLGPYLTRELPQLVEQVGAIIVPLLQRGMAVGAIRHQNPGVLAEFLVRTTVSLMLAPPAGDLQGFLDQTVLPLVVPDA